jgi:hypothetical protein
VVPGYGPPDTAVLSQAHPRIRRGRFDDGSAFPAHHATWKVPSRRRSPGGDRFDRGPETVASKQPAFFCELPPGDTDVNWRVETQTTLVELQWFDADGNVIAQTTVTPTRQMHMTFTQPTPSGAVEVGVSYADASGVYAVGGMVCQ